MNPAKNEHKAHTRIVTSSVMSTEDKIRTHTHTHLQDSLCPVTSPTQSELEPRTGFPNLGMEYSHVNVNLPIAPTPLLH